ncbi:proline-rich protein HaeIII subfamily 1 [Ornithorhynchus anatinus]|uniref:proline-rich protein HaeIII subfamily 1 n=1 Tax=Ornithorhynchus anatinus TaxID=9258 RepID=UPI0019D43CAF|nr:proline-rich protein HaeIII subfamily 1 [Ornithorhynchus anatinus]
MLQPPSLWWGRQSEPQLPGLPDRGLQLPKPSRKPDPPSWSPLPRPRLPPTLGGHQEQPQLPREELPRSWAVKIPPDRPLGPRLPLAPVWSPAPSWPEPQPLNPGSPACH